MDDNLSVFTKENLERELWQGEIITNVVQYIYDSVEEGVDAKIHNFALVMCQDCDLLQDYNKRDAGQDGDLLSILLYEADEAETITANILKSEIRRRILENREERYHYLEPVISKDDVLGCGIPALVIDFKRFFTITPVELHRQIASEKGATRRSRIQSPFKEHLQTRAAVYAGRVGLPRPHKRTSGG